MKIFYNVTEHLTPQSIDLISDTLVKLSGERKIDKKAVVQLRLITESILIDYMGRFGENTPCEIKMYRSFARYYVSVEVKGESFNPLKEETDVCGDDYVRMLVESATVAPSYQYTAGVNQIRLGIPKKKPSSVIASLAAIAAAFALQFILSFFPESVWQTVANDIFSPVGKTYLSLISMGGVLMIFLSLVSAISRMSSISKLKNTGGIVIKHLMGKNILFSLVFILIIPFLFGTVSGSSSSETSAGKQFLDIILGIVPSNLVDPFLEQNTLQVSFLALLLGTFLLINKKHAQKVIDVIDELNGVILSIIGFICSFMPFYIFVSFSGLLLTNRIDELKKSRMILLSMLLFAVIEVIITKLISKFKYKVPLLKNFKNGANIALTGFFTCSSIACLDANRKLCMSSYDMDENNLQFSLIFQQILYKVDAIICFLCFMFGLCSAFGIQYSLTGYIVITVSIILLAMSIPPIPGGPIAVMTPFLLSAGLPDEAVALFTAIFVFANMILVGAKVYCVSDELLAIDRKIKKGQNR